MPDLSDESIVSIKKIVIKNYRSCIDTTFEPNKFLSVLIGPNGSGKTTVMSAIRLLKALATKPHRRIANGESEPPAEITVHYLINKIEIIFFSRILVSTNEKNVDEVVSADEIWSIPSLAGRRKKIGVSSWMFNDSPRERSIGVPSWASGERRDQFARWLEERKLIPETMELLEKIASFVRGFTYYSASQFTNPGVAPISFEIDEASRRRVFASDHKRIFYDIHQEYLVHSEIYSEFLDVAGPQGIGLFDSLDFEEIPTSSSNYSVRTGGRVEIKERTNSLVVPQIKIGNSKLSPNQLSEGTFKTFALVFYLIADKSSVLMIEEPEVCVHHGLLNSIMELIKIYSKNKQVIVSTHSDAVLDKIEIESVFTVSRSAESGTVIAGIEKKFGASEIKALKHFLSNEGSLGEYWRHGDLETI